MAAQDPGRGPSVGTWPRWPADLRLAASRTARSKCLSLKILSVWHFCCYSVVQSCLTLWDPMDCSTPGFPALHCLPEFAQTHFHWIVGAIQPYYPLLPLPFLPSIFSSIRVFSNKLALHIRWPKYWSFNFSISPSMSIQGWFPYYWLVWFLTVQGPLKSLLQYHNPKTSILWLSTFFMVQLSHPYMTTGKTIALTRWTFVGKVMSLLFNMLSRLVIAFLPRSKHLLISWLQSPSAVILEPKKIKSVTALFPLFPHLFAMKQWDWKLWS